MPTLDPISNQATWIMDREVSNPDTGELLDLAGGLIEIVMRDPASKKVIFSGSTDDLKVVVTGIGTYRVTISEADMNNITPKTYDLAGRFTRDGVTEPLFIDQLPVRDGIFA